MARRKMTAKDKYAARIKKKVKKQTAETKRLKILFRRFGLTPAESDRLKAIKGLERRVVLNRKF